MSVLMFMLSTVATQGGHYQEKAIKYNRSSEQRKLLDDLGPSYMVFVSGENLPARQLNLLIVYM